jgi:hypothetical protein
LDTRLRTLLCKRIIVAKSKEMKTGCNLAESPKGDYGSARAVLPMMVMMPYIYAISNFGLEWADPSSEETCQLSVRFVVLY